MHVQTLLPPEFTHTLVNGNIAPMMSAGSTADWFPEELHMLTSGAVTILHSRCVFGVAVSASADIIRTSEFGLKAMDALHTTAYTPNVYCANGP